MLDHHLQRAIVYQLAFTHAARFSELKPDDVESKLFTYHLKKVISACYVEKSADGLYSLTPEGRRLGFQAVKSEQFILNKAYSVLFLVIRRKDSAWLLYTRGIHPLLGYTTFPVATPSAEFSAVEAAKHDLLAKTGLHGEFTARGGGFFHIYQDAELESYTNFTLLVCEDAQGELTHDDPNGTYKWVKNPDFSAADMLPNMKKLVELYEKHEPFFLEESFSL